MEGAAAEAVKLQCGAGEHDTKTQTGRGGSIRISGRERAGRGRKRAAAVEAH